MTESKVVNGLQRFFWIAGWLMLAVTALSILTAVYLYTKGLVVDLTQAFFAFFMSAVFGMIFHRQPVGSQRAERFLIITCCGFVLESLIRVYSTVEFAIRQGLLCNLVENPILNCGPLANTLQIVSHMTVLASALSPLLFAITIYVLFRHFTRMVTFEAEVV